MAVPRCLLFHCLRLKLLYCIIFEVVCYSSTYHYRLLATNYRYHNHGTGVTRRGRWHDGWIPTRAVVLRDARVYTLVDDGSSQRLCAGAMPHHLAVPAVLQRTRRILSKPGTHSTFSVRKHTPD